MIDNNIQAKLIDDIEVNQESVKKFKRQNRNQKLLNISFLIVVSFALIHSGYNVGEIVTKIMIIDELKSNIQSDWSSVGNPQDYEGHFDLSTLPDSDYICKNGLNWNDITKKCEDDFTKNINWNFFNIPDASAYPTPDKKVIYLQLVYVASGDKCDSEDIEAMNFYSNLSQYYFEKYGYLVADRNEYCQLYKNSYFVNYNPNYDLTIVMLDYEQSQIWQKDTNWYGMHSWSLHNGQNVHYIISTSQYDRTYDVEAAWTLTHEISHFVITNLRLPNSYHDDYVHKIQAEYDQCKPEIWKCKHLYDTALYKPAELDGRIPVAVMKPLLDYSVVS